VALLSGIPLPEAVEGDAHKVVESHGCAMLWDDGVPPPPQLTSKMVMASKAAVLKSDRIQISTVSALFNSDRRMLHLIERWPFACKAHDCPLFDGFHTGFTL
jgi:hypothetical protein